MNKQIGLVIGAMFVMGVAQQASAACSNISRATLQNAANYAASLDDTGGYGLPMWVTFVDETGKICQVVTTGNTGSLAGNSEWLGSRVISAQKANTANAFSLGTGGFSYAISTANLYSAVQPGGSLYGLQHSNPVDASRAYLGDPARYGGSLDPLMGQRIGGVNVFGGGLALYNAGTNQKIGAIGVSGDTSCRDHSFAWVVREQLNKEPSLYGITNFNHNVPSGDPTPVASLGGIGDEMILDPDGNGGYWAAWSQPMCPNTNTTHGVLTVPPNPS